MNNPERQLRSWKAIAATSVVITLMSLVAVLVIVVKNMNNQPERTVTVTVVQTDASIESVTSESTEISEEAIETSAVKADALSLWTADAEAKKALVSYVESVTDENSPDFIPVEDRIAVFDMDGTILCETDPYYFDHQHSRKTLQPVFRQNLMVTRMLKSP